jgi:hypothetical protein
MVTAINDYDVTPKVGSYIKPDGWPIGSCLVAGDSFSEFRLPTHQTVITSLAVRIEATGRTLQYKGGDLMVRVRIVFIGDCEPDSHTHGYMKVA